MAVLGVLRAHGANGAEVGISVAALLISALGLAFNLLKVAARSDGWLQVVPILEAVAIVLGRRRGRPRSGSPAPSDPTNSIRTIQSCSVRRRRVSASSLLRRP